MSRQRPTRRVAKSEWDIAGEISVDSRREGKVPFISSRSTTCFPSGRWRTSERNNIRSPASTSMRLKNSTAAARNLRAELLVERIGTLAHGSMSDLAIAMDDQVFEENGEPDRCEGSHLLRIELVQIGAQIRDERQIGMVLGQKRGTQLREPRIAIAEDRQKPSRYLPPMPQRRPLELTKRVDDRFVAKIDGCVGRHAHRRQDSEGGLPQVIGREVPFQGRLRTMGARVELRQRRRQTLGKCLVEVEIVNHEVPRIEWRSSDSSSPVGDAAVK